jgi:ABC-type lipoprotein release transport system permease subunit
MIIDTLGSDPIIYIPVAQADPRFIAVVHVWTTLATIIPTLRIARTDPATTLRDE